ncbi:hypothetical protein OAN21_02505 [Alphaproteobacteria bacterium]|nr:hypothetical protein [Alphaproteobacteria bacterium]
MKKFLPSFFLFLLTSLFLTESSIASPLRCKTHSSRACKNKDRFVREQKEGCASPAGNCRWYFCKANCVTPDKSDHATLRLCKKNCLNSPLLARFDIKTREALYSNFYPKGKGKRARKHSRDAYAHELGVDTIKSKRWWKFWGKSKKSQLLDRLKKEYNAQIARKTKRMEAAKGRGDTRKAKKIEKEIVTLVVEASSANVTGPDAGKSKAATLIQRNWRKHQKAKKGKAATTLQKYWRGRQGRKEAKRIREARAARAASLIEALPQSVQSTVLSSVNRQSGVWKTDTSGKKYFIPAPPPPPKSEKVKRLSAELSASRRSSTASDFNLADLPPPPASMLGDIPPPPPPAVRTSVVIPSPHTGMGQALRDQIHAGKPLKSKRPSTHRRSSSTDARGGLLADIQKGKKLKK